MFGGFMLADTSFWDTCASGGTFNSGSGVVCETFASPDVFASGGPFNSVSVVFWVTLACHTLIVAFKGFKNTVSVYTGLAAWKINDFH
jgi:hypothetical protein